MNIDALLRPSQTLIGALMFGLLMFVLVVAFMVGTGSFKPSMADSAPLFIALVAVWFPTTVAAFFLPGVMVSQIRRQWEADRPDMEPFEALTPRWQTINILRGALLEGPALFGVMVLLLTGKWAALLAPGVNLILMAATFPTRERLERFVEQVTGRR